MFTMWPTAECVRQLTSGPAAPSARLARGETVDLWFPSSCSTGGRIPLSAGDSPDLKVIHSEGIPYRYKPGMGYGTNPRAGEAAIVEATADLVKKHPVLADVIRDLDQAWLRRKIEDAEHQARFWKNLPAKWEGFLAAAKGGDKKCAERVEENYFGMPVPLT
jgi:hypothetical protein